MGRSSRKQGTETRLCAVTSAGKRWTSLWKARASPRQARGMTLHQEGPSLAFIPTAPDPSTSVHPQPSYPLP